MFLLLWLVVSINIIFWYIYLYKHKKLVSVLSTTVFMKIFIPLIIMYPFAFSQENSISTGYSVYINYLPFVNSALVISLVGILFFVVGCFISSQIKSKHYLMNIFSYSYETYLNKLHMSVFFFVLLALFGIMYKLGFFNDVFNGREFGMSNASIRPIANFFYDSCSFFMLLAFTYYYQRKSKLMLFFIIASIAFSMTSGTRSFILNSVLMFIFTYYNLNQIHKSKINFFKMASIGIVLLVLAIYIGDLRNGQYNFFISLSQSFDKILYGNNFSDLRDFSWLLSDWNGVKLHGKTFLAGLLSFIPSSSFAFRSEWSIGVFTANTIGFDPTLFPGLRPGIFGEAYLNFGYIGVGGLSFFYGFIVEQINRFVNESIMRAEDKRSVVFKVTLGYVVADMSSNLMITAGFFSVYVVLLLLLIGYVNRTVKSSKLMFSI